MAGLEVLKDFSLRLSKSISKLGKRMYQKSGAVDWESATRFFSNVQQDMAGQIANLGILGKDDISAFFDKFSELESFVDGDKLVQQLDSTKTASKKLLKSLLEAVEDLQDAASDATEERGDWSSSLRHEVDKIKGEMEGRWKEIKSTWEKIVKENNNVKYQGDDHHDDDDDDEDDDNEKDHERKGHKKDNDDDDDEMKERE